MLHRWTAMVAPRPAASTPPARAMSVVTTTRVVPLPATGGVSVTVHSLGTPAARHTLSQIPFAVKSPCAEGIQRKPTSRANTVIPPTPITLQRNQPLLHV